LYEFNDTTVDYPRDKTISQLFEEQAAKTPDSIGLVGSGQEKNYKSQAKKKKQVKEQLPQMTAVPGEGGIHGAPLPHAIQISYRELNEKSDRVARLLQSKGVEPGHTGRGTGNIVAIMPERTTEMIICLLGILKAGGAYLPIDPEYPKERINYILEDSNTKILLSGRKKLNEIDELKDFGEGVEIIDINTIYDLSPTTENRHPASGIRYTAANLAYIIYTSGTTGHPKGVMVEHRSVVRLVCNTDYVDFSRCDRLLQTGTLSFDASTFEIWGALENGLTLYLVKKENILSVDNLKKIVRNFGIDVIWMTSALFNHHVQEEVGLFKNIKHLVVGGDVVSPLHVNRLRKEYPGIRITNGYGPTENTTFSVCQAVDRNYFDKIPI
ncbi:MAG: AMP-binding protein, partial [bacterium]|nr:AMP-binding protein [bacterium]